MTITGQIAVVEGIGRERFEREIVPAGQPVIMKGLVANWPAVQAARTSNAAIRDYLKTMDTTKASVSVSVLPPGLKGRFFYKPDMSGFNFTVDKRKLAALLDWLETNEARDDFVTLYAQSLLLDDLLPGFEADNRFPVLDASVKGRMWLGNRVRTQTHFDPSHNIACVVAGKRRFTLFPPEQIDNLYPSPFDTAPGGVPVSMATIEEPDFERYPLLAEALKCGQYGDLEAGDALYIPYAWWHHVQSQTGFNILVNYWWNEAGEDWVAPANALYAAILAMRDLPQDQKRVWRHIMNRYVFDDPQAAVAHLPPEGQGAFGPLPGDRRKAMKAYLSRMFQS